MLESVAEITPRFAERVFRHVRGPWVDPTLTEADCWEFTGSWRSRFGYGRIREAGRGSRSLVIHRLMYVMIRGPIPGDKIARHVACNNPICCNPWHIEPGSYEDNELDKLAWGGTPLYGLPA